MNHPYTYNEQEEMMAKHQDVLRIALDFTCRSIVYWDSGWVDGNGKVRDCITWYTADGAVVAESSWTGISIAREHHDYVWNVFKLFL